MAVESLTTHGDIVNFIIGFGLILVGIMTFYLNSSAKYLSIREHSTYNDFIVRELNSIGHRLNVLEQTRPTTGEIEARMNGKTFQTQTIS